MAYVCLTYIYGSSKSWSALGWVLDAKATDKISSVDAEILAVAQNILVD